MSADCTIDLCILDHKRQVERLDWICGHGDRSKYSGNMTNFHRIKKNPAGTSHHDWTAIYQIAPLLAFHDESQDMKEYSDAISSHIEVIGPHSFKFNFAFCAYLRKLEKEAIIIQYQLAYLSTLGGAYHLVNKPHVALQIAKRQEYIGRRLGSTNLLVRAKVFQAVNMHIMGEYQYSQLIFEECKAIIRMNCWLEDVLKFVEASEEWVLKNYPPPSIRN